MNPNPSPKPPEPTAQAKLLSPDNFQTLLDAGAARGGINGIPPNAPDLPVIVVPSGYKLECLPRAVADQWAGKPHRKRGFFCFADMESFIRYFNEHKNTDSRVFAKVSDTGGKFYGILNFHGAEPSFNDHTCAIELVPTHEWEIWTGNAKRQMNQTQFATFLEEHGDMFVSPSGLDLMELVTNLEGKSHVDITQAVKLQTGAIKLNYTETVELKGGPGSVTGDIEIPKELAVSIAPFEGTTPREMRARLRYRIDQRKISFSYEPIDSHLHVRALCNDLHHTITSQTGTEPMSIAGGGLNQHTGEENPF